MLVEFNFFSLIEKLKTATGWDVVSNRGGGAALNCVQLPIAHQGDAAKCEGADSYHLFYMPHQTLHDATTPPAAAEAAPSHHTGRWLALFLSPTASSDERDIHMFTEEESFALPLLNAAQGICSYDDSNEQRRWVYM